jgi:transcription elongation factor GreA
MPEKKRQLTREGLARMQSELEHLRKVRIPAAIEAIREARGDESGDMEDNTELQEAQRDYAFLLGHERTLAEAIRDAEVVSEESGAGAVSVGSKVTVRSEEGQERTYTIVDSAEIGKGQGRVSNDSPVGRGLIGRAVGDTVEIATPAGVIRLTIVSIGGHTAGSQTST